MRKVLCICLLIAMLLSTTICAQAASARVWFVSDSSFQVDGTAMLDIYATCMSVVQASEANGNTNSDMYNAAIHMYVDCTWVCSNGSDKYGPSVTWTAADAGKEFVCRVGFYTDPEHNNFVDYMDSEPFTITAGQSLEFTIDELHDAVAGEPYYALITCTDKNAEFSEFMGSELSSFGLTLHSNGVIDGTPTKTGNCHINILATGPSGENSTSFDLTVIDSFEPSLEVLEYPTQTTYMVGECFNPAGMRVKITTFDGSILMSENGQYLEYFKEPLKTEGDVKIKLKHGDAFTFVYITVVPASSAGGDGDMPPSITMDSLPTAYVGEEYYVRIYCGDLDAEFWEYYNPGKPNDLSKTGLTIMKNGVLTGTPTQAGSYTFTICAGNDNGEDYATYTLIVKEKPVEPTEPDETEPVATEPIESGSSDIKTEKPDKADKTDKKDRNDEADEKDDRNSDDEDQTLLIVAIVVIGCIAIAGTILIIVLIKRKKEKQKEGEEQ